MHELASSDIWNDFMSHRKGDVAIKVGIGRYLRAWHLTTLYTEGQMTHLTKLIPLESRKIRGLRVADLSLSLFQCLPSTYYSNTVGEHFCSAASPYAVLRLQGRMRCVLL